MASTILGYPVYHVLLAVYFPLWLMSNNRGLFDTADVFRPILLSMGLALGAFAALAFLYRDRHKAAFLTTVGIACFYSFSGLRDLLPITSPGSGALVVLATVCLGAALLALKTEKLWPSASKILNGFLAAMLLIPAAKIADLQFGDVVDSKAVALENSRVSATKSVRPNIIHVVLDGYSRADVLKELYDWDNSDFIRSLQDLGFVVPAHATAAYSQTLLSMNSIFSLNYINDRISALAENNTDEELRLALNEDLQDSTLLQSLKSLKYTLINVESLYQGVHLENADNLIWPDENWGISYFEKTLIDFTPIGRTIERLAVKDATYTQVHFALAKHDYSKFKPPFFVYNHILAPHPPFNIAADGQFRPGWISMGDGSHRLETEPAWYEDYRRGYLEKLSYTNKKILEKVRHLLTNVPDPKIIVLHSDHGGGLMLDKDNRARTCLKERMSAFLAVYSSGDVPASEIPDRVNLVNLYRILLRDGFGANLPLLPSRSYFAPWDEPQSLELVSMAELETFGPTCARPRDTIARRR